MALRATPEDENPRRRGRRDYGKRFEGGLIEIRAERSEGYRIARLTAGEVARVLGLETSIAAQGWLAQKGVEPNYGTDDFTADIEDLSRHFPELNG